MKNILVMKVSEAFEDSKTNNLADKIWNYKHPDESEIDRSNREYLSWKNSASFFLQAAIDAGLGSLDIAFEVPTPLGDYIDVALMGSSHNLDEQEFGRLLIVELKQWQSIYPYENENYVEISVGKNEKDIRRHPVSQIYEYKKHMENNHHGIYKNGRVKIDTLAYLHNFIDKESLLKGVYDVWDEFKEKVFVKNEEEKLVAYLRDSFSNANNSKLPEIIDDCGYIMGKVGFEGLLDALNGKENTTMVKDQMPVVDYVREHLMNQKKIPHKEIIVVSGGPGTGKTIVGMHFIYDYADIFQGKNNADGSVFCLPRSKTVKAIIDHECHSEIVPYLDNINRNQKVVVVDEAHRITGLKNTLDKVFNKGTNLLILLQDDHQRIRPGEDGILAGIENYANTNGIEFSILNLNYSSAYSRF